jgi:hypothetical protein
VTFSPGTPGGKPTSSYLVSTTDVTDPNAKVPVVSGPASPITVTGLANAHTYTFTVAAVSPDGSGPPSAPSERIAAGIPSAISGTPPAGTVGVFYTFTFTVTGAPTPSVNLSTVLPLPAGLSFDPAKATISGTPTTAESKMVVVSANNGVGSAVTSPTIVINPRGAVGGDQPTPTPTIQPLSPTAPAAGPAVPPAHVTAAATSGRLASTGTSLSPLIGWAATLILFGAALVILRRRSGRARPEPDLG